MTEHQLAIIGAGAIARDHVSAIAQVPGISVTHVVDRNADRARALAAMAGDATWSTTVDTAWSADVDATLVCTSPDSHADYAIAALRAGKAVMVEKPVALSLSEVDRTLAASEEAQRPLLVGQTARFQPVHQEFATSIASGAIGIPRLAHLTWYTGHVWPGGWRGWQLDPARSGGHLVHNGIHALDLLTWLLGDSPRQVFARPLRTWSPGITTPNSFQLVVRFAGGALATIEICYALSERSATVRRLMVAGTAGTLLADSENESKPLASTEGALVQQFRHFRDVLRGAMPATTPDQVRAALAGALAAQHSADTGVARDVEAEQ